MTLPVRVIDPPASALLMQVASPAFSQQPLDVVHPERVPAAVFDLSVATRTPHFSERTIRVWHLRDVFVGYEGLVFDRRGDLYRPSITQHGPQEIAWAAERLPLAGPPAPQHSPMVLGVKRGASNYGHWLIEMLPMLDLVLSRLRDERIGVIVHNVSDPQLGEVMQTSLRRLCIADGRVLVAGFEPIHVHELILVEGLTDHGRYMSPRVRSPLERLADGIGGMGHERVFIARGAGSRRDFADPLRAEAIARSEGYHVFQAHGATLAQQITMLRDARVVAGVMGAAMTSLVFARASAQILMFAGAAMPDTFFCFLANLFGHRYREIRCLQSGDSEPDGMDYDRPLLIEDEELRRMLRQAGSGVSS